MNAVLTIQVKVIGQQAQAQIRALEKEVARLKAAGAAVTTTGTAGAAAMGGMGVAAAGMAGQTSKAAKSAVTNVGAMRGAWQGLKEAQLQSRQATAGVWKTMGRLGRNFNLIGRQLLYGFTIPLGLAAYGATKWGLEVEAAFIRVKKVYGDTNDSTAELTAELSALRESFRLLSDAYGISQEEVINLGGAFAAVGFEAQDLAKVTKAAMEIIILGEIETEAATKSIIGIMSAFGLSLDREVLPGVNELTYAFGVMNAVENATGATMQDLLDGLQRAGGVARNFGIDIRELSGLIASLVPATGSGAEAGQALKTIFSRLSAPTKQAKDVLQAIGVEYDSAEWLNSQGMKKLELLTNAWTGLTQNQKNYASSIVASRWQVNKFNVLMDDLEKNFHGVNGELSNFGTAMDATSDPSKVMETYNKELLTFLKSDPRRFEILMNQIKNIMADIGISILPWVVYFFKVIKDGLSWFDSLNPKVKNLAVSLLALGMLAGPLVLLLGVLVRFAQIPVFFWRLAKAFIASAGWIWKAIIIMGKGVGWLVTTIRIAASVIWMNLVSIVGGAFKFLGFAIGFALNQLQIFVTYIWVTVLPAIKGALTAAVSALGAAIMAHPVVAIVVLIAALVALATILYFTNDTFREFVDDIGRSIYDFFVAVGSWVMGIATAIWDTVDGIVEAVFFIPRAFVKAITALANFLKKAIAKIVDMLSYLNPFTRHSPSLVESVTLGVQEILSQYEKLAGIPTMLNRAAQAHQNFLNATGGRYENDFQQSAAEGRTAIMEQDPGALDEYDAMVASYRALISMLPALNDEIQQQSMLVAVLQKAYDDLDDELKQHERRLDLLKYAYELLDDQIKAATDAIDALASTPILGMGAYEDEIFGLEMQVKSLELALMDLEDAGANMSSLDDMMASLQGDLEMLNGERANLAAAGAGSDILNTYDEMIRSIEAQQKALAENGTEVTKINDEIADLQRQIERLNLEQSLNFDPQIRQIEKMTNLVAEMPFDEIVRQIEQQQAIVAKLTPEYEAIGAAIKEEERTIAAIKIQQDAVGWALDDQKDKLDALKTVYSEIESLTSDILSSIKDTTSALKDAAGADLPGGDYEIPGGALFDSEGTAAEIEQWNQELERMMKGWEDEFENPFADIFDFEGIKESLANLSIGVALWFQDSFFGDIAGWIGRNFSIEGLSNVGDEIKGFFSDVGWWILDKLTWPFRVLWSFIGPPLMTVVNFIWEIFVGIGNAIQAAWTDYIYPALAPFVNFFKDYIWPVLEFFLALVLITFDLVGKAISWAWENVIMPVLGAFAWVITNIGNVFWWLWEKVVQPVWDWISGKISWAWENVISPVMSWLMEKVMQLGAIFNWLWEKVVKPVWDKIKDAISWAWNNVMKPIFEAIWSWIVTYLGPVWEWLKNAFASAWLTMVQIVTNVKNAIVGVVEGMVNTVIGMFNTLARGVNAVAAFLGLGIRVGIMPFVNWTGSGPWGLFEEGGINLGGHRGGKFDEITAIVGEGKKGYPEYVIPTDPAYRGNAEKLLAMAIQQLGMPAYKDGGILGGLTGILKKITGGAAMGVFQPFKFLMKAMMKLIPSDFLKGYADQMLLVAEQWVKNATGMAQGGVIVPHGRGVHMLVGEGMYDEKVQVTPLRGGSEGGTLIQINGDLSFPNIHNGNDAEKLIANLKALAS